MPKAMQIGIIKEGKTPPDRRVLLTPEQCKETLARYPELGLQIQTSALRCYSDQEYAEAGFATQAEVGACEVMLGIKEVPIEMLIPHKTYFFFSHTIKKQPYNRGLLQAILAKGIRLIDWERLTDEQGNRVIAFGRFAGLVGAYNGIRTFGIRNQAFALKPAHQCFDMAEMWLEFKKVKLPAVKIAVTGGGRVSQGAMEILDGMGIRKVSVSDYLQKNFEQAVYTQLDPVHYNRRKDGKAFDLPYFFSHPEQHEGDFNKFLPVTDLLIAGAYWDPKAPVLFTPEQAAQADCRIKVIADITCDIEGSIPSTLRPSSIDDPFYDYDPGTHSLKPAFSGEQYISVMAIDNLPNELPRDASQSFGEQFLQHVLPELLKTESAMLGRATIAEEGQLTQSYAYLQDFVDGKA